MKKEREAKQRNIFTRVYRFYVDGFRNMTLGKTLWMIIGIKLFIMFFVLKLFFFPNYLSGKADTPEEKAKFVTEEVINRR